MEGWCAAPQATNSFKQFLCKVGRTTGKSEEQHFLKFAKIYIYRAESSPNLKIKPIHVNDIEVAGVFVFSFSKMTSVFPGPKSKPMQEQKTQHSLRAHNLDKFGSSTLGFPKWKPQNCRKQTSPSMLIMLASQNQGSQNGSLKRLLSTILRLPFWEP